MATWNYRIIDHGDYLGLHEVHYHSDGSINSYTEEPITFVADPEEGKEGIIGGLRLALESVEKRPVLNKANLP